MIKSNPKYKPLYTANNRYFIITGGRGSGKSFEVNTWASLLTYEINHRLLFTRYTMTSANISIVPEFTEKITMLDVEQDFSITRDGITNLKSHSDILFKGIKTSSGNQTAALKSLQGVTTWVLDEAEELVDEAEFDTIDLSIRKKGAQNRIVLILNPTTKEHWIWKRFFEGYTKYIEVEGEQIPTTTHPDVCHIHTTYLDNKANLSDTFIKNIQAIKELRPEKYRHLILGGWLDKAEGAIYDNWIEGDFNDELPFAYGMDFGFVTDPSTLIKVAVKDDKIYVKELLYKPQLTTSEIISFLDETVTKDDLIVADSAEPRMITEILQEGYNIYPSKKGAGSIKMGISKIKDYQLIVDEDSHNLKKELSNYTWNNKKANIPNDSYNHLLDALRYAVGQLVEQETFFFQ